MIQVSAAQVELFEVMREWQEADDRMQALLEARYGSDAGEKRYDNTVYDTPELQEAHRVFRTLRNLYEAKLEAVRRES